MKGKGKKTLWCRFLSLTLLFFFGCTSKGTYIPLYEPPEKKQPFFPSPYLEPLPAHRVPEFSDDMDGSSLIKAIDSSLIFFRLFNNDEPFYMGQFPTTVAKVRDTLLFLRDIARKNHTEIALKDFHLFRARGDDGTGKITFTGYYEPLLYGSLERSERFKYPLYRAPTNMLKKYTRKEIDRHGALAGKGLELLWVDDPVELFFLHIQGSGKIELEDGRTINVGFDGTNGYPYTSIGTYLLKAGKLTENDLSMVTIKKYLRDHPAERDEILDKNERYVFFRIVTDGPRGALAVPLTGGRTIASNLSLYPKGAPALIFTKKPIIKNSKVIAKQNLARLVFNQDTGVALSRAGRVDIFMGSGEEAALQEGFLKETGELYFLLKK